MAMIHINRNRENLGKFNDQEVADGLKSGRFLSSDLAWCEPMPTWQPLSTFTDLPEPTPEGSHSIPVEEAFFSLKAPFALNSASITPRLY